ncbi:MAG: hypothetical protein WD533_06900 [Dehalococcoidia bacterium]
MGRRSLLAPALAAAFPILFLYAHNAGQVTAASVVPVLLVAVAVAVLLALALRLLLRDHVQASLTATVWILLFFLYGHVSQALNGIEIGGLGLGAPAVLLPLWLVAAAVPLVPASHRKMRNLNVLPYATGALGVVVVLNVATVGMTEAGRLGDGGGAQDSGVTLNGSGSSEPPDIYYIVPDRYPSPQVSEEYLAYDNSEFMGFLEDSGFYIADETFANYHATYLSLASSLNMEYLDALAGEVGDDRGDHTTAHRMMEDNEIWRILKEQYGYDFVHFGSWWGPTEENPNADVSINKPPRLLGLIELRDEFSRLLLRTSVLGPFQDWFLRQDTFVREEAEVEQCNRINVGSRHPNDVAREQCHRALYAFEQLKEMPSTEGPKFVFVHLLIPHPPFVFAADGEVIEDPPAFYYWDAVTDEEVDVLKQSKVEQIKYTNTRLQESIEHILEASDQPPIIILQSDEGPWTHEYQHSPREEWTPETFRTRHGIINAYHFPGVDAEAALYPSITPVNTFRVIFNEYFNADLPLLEDRAYMSASDDDVYNFIDVTQQARPTERADLYR